jgi:hypothetical protein
LDTSVSRRTLAYLGVALALLAAARILWSPRSAPPAAAPEASAPSAGPSASAPAPVVPLRRPPNAVAEFGVLTDMTEAQLAPLVDRDALGASLKPDHCGDPTACEAVRATLRDERATSLQVVDASSWNLAHADLDAAAPGTSAADRARILKRARVVVVHVAGPASRQAIALRTALAATAAIAQSTGGTVWDQLLNRIESARDFAKHAPTEPLDASVFRADRVALLYEPANAHDAGPQGAPDPTPPPTMRVLTAGLSRWGAPDVEWRDVPAAASARVAQIVFRVAQAIAAGAENGPIVLSREDVGGAPSEDDAGDAAEPEARVALDLVPAQPENGDPNDFFARIEPPGGSGTVATIELVEKLFGPFLATAPEPSAQRAQTQAAQSSLGATLAKWANARTTGAKLLVRVPFAIPGDVGVESMWLEVSSFDARTVTGTLVDEPLGATDFARGDRVTRPRADIERVELRAGRDE